MGFWVIHIQKCYILHTNCFKRWPTTNRIVTSIGHNRTQENYVEKLQNMFFIWSNGYVFHMFKSICYHVGPKHMEMFPCFQTFEKTYIASVPIYTEHSIKIFSRRLNNRNYTSIKHNWNVFDCRLFKTTWLKLKSNND